MKYLQKYGRWDKIKDNILLPIKFNSLTNLDLRRGSLNLIPKIIHQIWFRETEVSSKIKKLQSTIK
jgi:mannosyltransferase OCH1-like enzyme